MKTAKREDGTKERLLDAAAEVFSEEGFNGATTRAVAARAGANVASLHYHFGDKRGIYLRVMERHVEKLLEESPLERGFVDGPPERKLQALIDAILRRVLARDDALEWRLFLRELVDSPSGARDMILDRIAKPHIAKLSEAARAILGPKATEEEVRLCAMSVVSQVVFHRFGRAAIERLLPEQKYGEKDVAKLSKHIFEFSLDALKARRRRLERKGRK